MSMPVEKKTEKMSVDMKFRIEQETGPSSHSKKEKVTAVIGLMTWMVSGNLYLMTKSMMKKAASVIGLKVLMVNIHSLSIQENQM